MYNFESVVNRMIVHTKHPIPNVIRVTELVNFNQIKLHDTKEESRKEAHDFWEFLYLESGKLNVLVDGELYTLSPGDLILYPPHSFHSVAMSESAIATCISFSTNSLALFPLTGRLLLLPADAQQKILDMITLKKKLFSSPPNASANQGMTFRGMVLRKEANPSEIQKLANLLENFLLELSGTKSRDDNKRFQESAFAAFTEYLKAHLDRSLSLDEICTDCAISTSYLQKLCRNHCGCGPITYFLSLKIGAAKQMMQEGTLNFTQIAEHLGFSSVHYFSKLFKSKTGMSPSEYQSSVSETR